LSNNSDLGEMQCLISVLSGSKLFAYGILVVVDRTRVEENINP